MGTFFSNKRRSLRMKMGTGSLRFTGTPPLSRPYVGSSSSHQSSCSGSSWILWREPGISTHHNRGRICSILLGIAVFFVVVSVLAIAGLAVYMGALRIDTTKVNLLFDGGFRVTSGDYFTNDLIDNSSNFFKEKAYKYQSLISNVYQRSILSPAFKQCIISNFENGSLIVFFRLTLDRRKIPNAIMGNIEDSTKEILIDEFASSQKTFHNVSIDMSSVFIRRHSEESSVHTSSFHTLNHFHTLLDNRTLEVRNGVILKSPTPNSSHKNTESRSTVKTENTTSKNIITTQSISTEDSKITANKSEAKGFLNNDHGNSTFNTTVYEESRNDTHSLYSAKNTSNQEFYNNSSQVKDLEETVPNYMSNGSTNAMDFDEVSRKNVKQHANNSDITLNSPYTTQEPAINTASDRNKAESSRVTKSDNYYIIEEYMPKSSEEDGKDNGPINTESRYSHYDFLPVSVIEESSKIGTKVLIPHKEVSFMNTTDTPFNPEILRHNTYNHRYNHHYDVPTNTNYSIKAEKYSPHTTTQQQTTSLYFEYQKENFSNVAFNKKIDDKPDIKISNNKPLYDEPWKPIIPIDTQGDILQINSDKLDGIAEIVVIPPSSIDIEEKDQNPVIIEKEILASISPHEISVMPHEIDIQNNGVSHANSENNITFNSSRKNIKSEGLLQSSNKNSSDFKEQTAFINNIKNENKNKTYKNGTLIISFNESEIFHTPNDFLEENSQKRYNSTDKKHGSIFDFPEFPIVQQFENFHSLIQKLNKTFEGNETFSNQEKQMIKPSDTHNNSNDNNFQDPVKILTHISSSIHNRYGAEIYDYDLSTTSSISNNKEIIDENLSSSTQTSEESTYKIEDTARKKNPSILTDHFSQKSTLALVVTERSEEEEAKDRLSTFPPISSLEIIEVDDDETLKDKKINLSHKEVINGEQKDESTLSLVTLLPVKSNLGVLHPLRPRPITHTTVASNLLSQSTIIMSSTKDKEITGMEETEGVTLKVGVENERDVPNIYSIFKVEDNSKDQINHFPKENNNQSKDLSLSVENHLFSGTFNLTTMNEDILYHVKNSDNETSKNMSDKLTRNVVSEKYSPVLGNMQDKLIQETQDKNEEHNENQTLSKLQTQTLHTKAILELITHSRQQIKHSDMASTVEEISKKTDERLNENSAAYTAYVSTTIPQDIDAINGTEQNISKSIYKGDIPPINTTVSLTGANKKVVVTSTAISRNTDISDMVDPNPELSDFSEESVYIKLPDVKDIYRLKVKETNQSKYESKSNIEVMDIPINHCCKPEKPSNNSSRQSKMNLEATLIKDFNPITTTQTTKNFEDFIEDVINGVTNSENSREKNSLYFLDNYLKQKHFTKESKNSTAIFKLSPGMTTSAATDLMELSVTKQYSYEHLNNVTGFNEGENKFEDNLFNSTFTTESIVAVISDKTVDHNQDVSIPEKIVVNTNFSVSKIAVTRKNETSVEMSVQESAKSNDTQVALTIPKNYAKLHASSKIEIRPISQEKNQNHVINSPISEQVMTLLKQYAVVHLSTQSKSTDKDVDDDNDKDDSNSKNNSSTVDKLVTNRTYSGAVYVPHKNYANENKLLVNNFDENSSYSFFPAFAMLTKVYNKISTTENYDAFVGVFPEDETSIEIVSNAEECPSNLSIRCGDGECISEMSRCNQLVDCNDGADERDCTCADYLRAQFLTRKLCDGIVDCWDFTDENDCEWCSPGQFVCPNSEVCINQEELCDGQRNCPYGDDEKQCFTISNNRALAGEFSYHKEGFLMVRKEGKWGKLCIQNFDLVVSQSRTSWKVTDLGRAVCRAMTYSDFDQVDRMIDHTENREVDQEEYYELGFNSSESNESSARSSLSFKLTSCSKKEVMHVKCKNLECGVRPKAIGQWARSRHSRIVGGGNASPGSWPWLAALYKEGDFQCGGTLISDMWLISAGHCFYHSLDDYWVARLGALRRGTNFPSPYEQLHPISHILLHPGYIDAGYINDISLLKMEQPVAFSDYIRPICLPPPNFSVKDGKLCTVVGWGQLFEVGRIFPDTLQEVELPIISTAECRKRTLFLPLYRVTDNMFCAGYERGGRDACLGDSGGPLMCQEKNGRWSLYGVTSNGYGCARANRPGVYTKVSNYANWIDSAINQEITMMRSIKNYCKGHRCPLGECLPQNRVCNGFMECSDGSDERGCW